MQMALLVHRVGTAVDSMPPQLVLEMATQGGAAVLGQPEIGSIEVGKAADLAVFRLDKIDYAGAMADPAAAILMCGAGAAHGIHDRERQGSGGAREARWRGRGGALGAREPGGGENAFGGGEEAGSQVPLADGLKRRGAMRRMGLFVLAVAFVCGLSALSAQAATFTVINTNDVGAGSLRAAINSANAAGGPDTINFAVVTVPANNPITISPTGALPTITDQVIIDGWTQTGTNCPPGVEIEGRSVPVSPTAIGLNIQAPNCHIRGLVINRFPAHGIYINHFTGANQIYGCYIGTDRSGTVGLGNGNERHRHCRLAEQLDREHAALRLRLPQHHLRQQQQRRPDRGGGVHGQAFW